MRFSLRFSPFSVRPFFCFDFFCNSFNARGLAGTQEPVKDFGPDRGPTVLPGREETCALVMNRQQEQQQQQQQQITTTTSSSLSNTGQRSVNRTEQHVTRQFTQTTQRQGTYLFAAHLPTYYGYPTAGKTLY